MKLVEPVGDVPKRNVLLYGPPKTGKTAGALTAPGPILLLNADLPNATWFALRNTESEVFQVEYESFDETLRALEKGIKDEDLTFGGSTPKPVETLVIDPINELYTQVLDEYSRRAVAPTLPTYGKASKQLERFYRFVCKSTLLNVVLVAHDLPVTEEGEDQRITERLPAAGTSNPALGRKVMSMVDVIGYTAAAEKEGGGFEYVAQLVNGKGRRGGDRFDNLLAEGQVARTMDLTEWFGLTAAEEPQKEAVAA